MCWWLCWYFDDCVGGFLLICWCVDNWSWCVAGLIATIYRCADVLMTLCWWLCWCMSLLSWCLDVLRCRWLCWCVDDCVAELIALCWCVDALMAVLRLMTMLWWWRVMGCWGVDVLSYWGVVGLMTTISRCVDVLMIVSMTLSGCVDSCGWCVVGLMTAICWCGDDCLYCIHALRCWWLCWSVLMS